MRGTLTAAAVLLLLPAAAGAGEPASPCPAGEALEAYVGKSLEAKTAKDRYALALWCREKGLLAESAAQMREAVRIDPEFAPAREALGDRKVEGRWVPPEEAMLAKGLVRHDGRWVLPEEKEALEAPAAERERRAREEARARTLLETMAAGGEREARLAREALSGVPDRAKAAPLAYALRAKSRDVRLFAAGELGRIRDRRTLKALVHRALRDPEADVRAACVDAAKAVGDPELLAPFARAFLSVESPEVRAAAAEAIGRTGDVRGIAYLVYAIEGHGGGPRSHIYTATQLSFVQDFDVEVAQTAFIADPQIGVLQEGAVLDVKVASTEWYSTRVERVAIGGALRRLSGVDHGWDAAAWRRWMAENRSGTVAAK